MRYTPTMTSKKPIHQRSWYSGLTGNMLEVIGRFANTEVFTIFHAMVARPAASSNDRCRFRTSSQGLRAEVVSEAESVRSIVFYRRIPENR
jgi:hypothetical protein